MHLGRVFLVSIKKADAKKPEKCFIGVGLLDVWSLRLEPELPFVESSEGER